MKFAISLISEDLTIFRQRVADIEAGGFDVLGVGDSPLFDELYVTMAVAVGASQHIRIGPAVTNAVTRHPQVIASAMRTLDKLSGARMFLGLATGDSAVRGLGLRPSTLADLERAMDKLRQAGVPIFLAANGPRTLRLAGRICDGAMLGAGISDSVLRQSIVAVRDGEEVGRQVPTEIWAVARTWVTDDPQHDYEQLDPLLAAVAHHVLLNATEGVPANLIRPVRTFCESYSYQYHALSSAGSNPNAALIDELGLRSYITDRFALLGPPSTIIERLRVLERAGVEGVIIPAIVGDPDTLIRRLSQEVIPAFR